MISRFLSFSSLFGFFYFFRLSKKAPLSKNDFTARFAGGTEFTEVFYYFFSLRGRKEINSSPSGRVSTNLTSVGYLSKDRFC